MGNLEKSLSEAIKSRIKFISEPVNSFLLIHKAKKGTLQIS